MADSTDAVAGLVERLKTASTRAPCLETGDLLAAAALIEAGQIEHELVEAIRKTGGSGGNYWPMNALAKKLGLYIDDLGEQSAWRAMAKAVGEKWTAAIERTRLGGGGGK
jgi:hypothetical protein